MGSDPKAPPVGADADATLAAYVKYFPELMKINADNILPTAQAQLGAEQQVAPAYNQLQAQMYDAYGPLMADTANRIAAQQAQSSAQSDLNVLNGTGKQLIQSDIEASKLADPEYYQARQQMGGRLGDLLSSIDLSGKVSGGEQEAMNRELAQQNQQRGLQTAPSATAALSNALTFGNNIYNRQQQAKTNLGQALSVGNQFLPASQSGIDPFKIATGRDSTTNAGDAKFQGVNQNLGQNVMDSGNNYMNNLMSMQQQANQINSQRRDQLDRFNQSWSSVVGSL